MPLRIDYAAFIESADTYRRLQRPTGAQRSTPRHPVDLDYISYGDVRAVVESSPSKYRFEGLDGWHQSFAEAYNADPRVQQSILDSEMEALAEGLAKLDGPDPDWSEWPIQSYKVWLEFNEYADSDSRRDEYIAGRMEDCQEIVADGIDMEPADWARLMIEEHPPVEVLCRASGQGVPLDRVHFLCPSNSFCANPFETDDGYVDRGGNDGAWHHHYCGNCGLEIGPTGDVFAELAMDLGIVLWPFVEMRPLHREEILEYLPDERAISSHRIREVVQMLEALQVPCRLREMEAEPPAQVGPGDFVLWVPDCYRAFVISLFMQPITVNATTYTAVRQVCEMWQPDGTLRVRGRGLYYGDLRLAAPAAPGVAETVRALPIEALHPKLVRNIIDFHAHASI